MVSLLLCVVVEFVCISQYEKRLMYARDGHFKPLICNQIVTISRYCNSFVTFGI